MKKGINSNNMKPTKTQEREMQYPAVGNMRGNSPKGRNEKK